MVCTWIIIILAVCATIITLFVKAAKTIDCDGMCNHCPKDIKQICVKYKNKYIKKFREDKENVFDIHIN